MHRLECVGRPRREHRAQHCKRSSPPQPTAARTPPALSPSLNFWRHQCASGPIKCLCTLNRDTCAHQGRRSHSESGRRSLPPPPRPAATYSVRSAPPDPPAPPAPTCSNRFLRSAASGWPSKFIKRRADTCGGTRASTAGRLKAGPPAHGVGARRGGRVQVGGWGSKRASPLGRCALHTPPSTSQQLVQRHCMPATGSARQPTPAAHTTSAHQQPTPTHPGAAAHQGPGAAASACRRPPPAAAPRPRQS